MIAVVEGHLTEAGEAGQAHHPHHRGSSDGREVKRVTSEVVMHVEVVERGPIEGEVLQAVDGERGGAEPHLAQPGDRARGDGGGVPRSRRDAGHDVEPEAAFVQGCNHAGLEGAAAGPAREGEAEPARSTAQCFGVPFAKSRNFARVAAVGIGQASKRPKIRYRDRAITR